MRKDNFWLKQFFWVISDGMVIFLSFLLAFWLRFYSGLFIVRGVPPLNIYLKLLLFVVAGWLIVFKSLGVYRKEEFVSPAVKFLRISEGLFWGMVFLMAGTFFYRGFSYSRLVIGFGGVFSLFFLAGSHFLGYFLQAKLGRKQAKKILIIGANKNGEMILRRIQRHPELGFLPIRSKKVEALESIVNELKIDEVIITLASSERDKILKVINFCREKGIKFLILPDLYELLISSIGLGTLDGLPLIGLKKSPLERLGNRFLKRAMDVSLSFLVLLITAPVFLILACIIKLTSPGPVFFRQERIGFDNNKFRIFKFRSMYSGQKGSAWTEKDDARCTKVGKFLRRTNLDELPQFFNVLKGEMSIVGPRPFASDDVEFQKIPYFSQRQRIKPGISGWAQVNGLRGGHIEPEERIRYDLYYIENWSIWLDFTILLMTPLSLKHAY